MPEQTQEREYLWFLDTFVTVHIGHGHGADRISLLEHRAAFGDSPPLHVHDNEDEGFHVLEGRLRVRVDNAGEFELEAQNSFLAPKGVAHTYRVESAEGARWLTVTNGTDFENFVRAAGRPADRQELPPPSGPPSEEQVAQLSELSESYGIHLVGPPLQG